MKKLVMAALVAAQSVAAAQPALAADLVGRDGQQMGSFAGARLRIALDGPRQERQLRAGLTLAPTMRIQDSDGASRLRVGEGVEFGIVGNQPARLSLGGVPVNRLAQGPAGPNGERRGVSTLGWIGIGVGATILVAAGAGYLWFEDAMDCDPGDDCS